MEKEVKKIKKNEKAKEELKNEAVILGKNEKKLIKFMGLIISFFATSLALLIFVFSVMASLSIAHLTKDTLVNNNIVVILLSKLNGYSISEVKEMIMTMSNRFTFILFEIIIPAIAFIGSMILLAVLTKKVFDFVSDINTEKDLFSKKKVREVQDIIGIISIVLLATLVIFNEPSIIFYLFIELLLGASYILFKKCVLMQKNNQ